MFAIPLVIRIAILEEGKLYLPETQRVDSEGQGDLVSRLIRMVTFWIIRDMNPLRPLTLQVGCRIPQKGKP